MTLVFVSMFLVIFVSLTGLVNRSYHEGVLQAQDETAFQVAESGLNYARWRLAHDPDNFDNETRTVTDQQAGSLGTYELTFEPPPTGSTVVEITSVGQTVQQPTRNVTLTARYGRPSLARFTAVTNSDVWYGSQVKGPVHANGGIRMDGTSDSTVSSAKETYACQPYHGCSSPYQTKPGVWGTGVLQELWEFPAPAIDYQSLTVDLLAMRTAAQAADMYYGPSGSFGYQIIFDDDNTYAISRVTGVGPSVYSYFSDTGYEWRRDDVTATELVEIQAVPTNGIIYVEDDVWIHGDIRDRVTVAAGAFPDTPSTNVDITLDGDISYGGVRDGTRSFGVVAQRHIRIPYTTAPDQMELEGAFVAQKGSFHRRYYPSGAHRLKTQLSRYGMIASNGVPATAWLNGSGTVISGFQQSSSEYDPYLRYAPPPYFPTSGQYEFISWEEQQ